MAYIITNSEFKPLTLDEKLAPYLAYSSQIEKLDNAYNKELLSLSQINALLPEGSVLKAQSQQLIEDLNESVNALYSKGLNSESRRALNNLRLATQSFITPATNAITKYDKYLDERAALENQYGKENILFRDSYTIDDFANKESGKEISYHPSYINLYNLDKNIINDVVATASNAGHTKIGSRKEGNNTIGRYYSGYSFEDVRNMKGDLKTIYDNAKDQIINTYPSLSEEELQIVDSRIMEAIALGASQTYKEYEQVDNTYTPSSTGSIADLKNLKWMYDNIELNEDGSFKTDKNGNFVFKSGGSSSNTNYGKGIGIVIPEEDFEGKEGDFTNATLLHNTIDIKTSSMTSIDDIKDLDLQNKIKGYATKLLKASGSPGTINDYNIYFKEISDGWFSYDDIQIYLDPINKDKIYSSVTNSFESSENKH